MLAQHEARVGAVHDLDALARRRLRVGRRLTLAQQTPPVDLVRARLGVGVGVAVGKGKV